MCKVNILELEIRDVKLISKVSLKKVNIDCIGNCKLPLSAYIIHYSIRLRWTTFPISATVDSFLCGGVRIALDLFITGQSYCQFAMMLPLTLTIDHWSTLPAVARSRVDTCLYCQKSQIINQQNILLGNIYSMYNSFAIKFPLLK